MANSSRAGHGGRQRTPVPLDQRGERQAAGDAGERVVDEPGRQALDLPVDHGEEHAAEDEGEHGGELGAEAEAPEGEGEQDRRGGVEGVLLHDGGARHGLDRTDDGAAGKSSILAIRPLERRP